MSDLTLQTLPVRLSFAGTMRAGQEVEVRWMLGHPMESGFRHDSAGQRVPKDIIEKVVFKLDDGVLFEAQLGTGMSANPMLFFPLRLPERGGTLVVEWTDDQGRRGSLRRPLVYVG